VRTLLGYSFADYLTDLIWLLAGVAVVLGVWQLLRDLGTRFAAWRRAATTAPRVLRAVPATAGDASSGSEPATAGDSSSAETEPPSGDSPGGETH